MNHNDQPLGKVFTELAKAYAGSFVDRLRHLPINRYFYALVVIDQHSGNLSQTDLASELYVDKASLVRMLDYLEAEDCIVRKPNPRDRRAHILELTPKALAMIPEIADAIQSTNAGVAKQAQTLGIPDFEKVITALMRDFQSKSSSDYTIQFVPRNDA